MGRAANPIEREERRSKVAKGLLAGKTGREMAQELSVNKNTITADIVAIRQEWRDARADANESLASEQLARLNELLLSIWDDAVDKTNKGRTWFVDRALSIMDQQARLVDLYPPLKTRVDVVTRDAVTAEIERLEGLVGQAGRSRRRTRATAEA